MTRLVLSDDFGSCNWMMASASTCWYLMVTKNSHEKESLFACGKSESRSFKGLFACAKSQHFFTCMCLRTCNATAKSTNNKTLGSTLSSDREKRRNCLRPCRLLSRRIDTKVFARNFFPPSFTKLRQRTTFFVCNTITHREPHKIRHKIRHKIKYDTNSFKHLFLSNIFYCGTIQFTKSLTIYFF